MSAPRTVQRTEAPTSTKRRFRVDYRAGGIGTTIVEASTPQEAEEILRARFRAAAPEGGATAPWSTDVKAVGFADEG